jgi:WD40 repeat protein
LDRVIGNNIFSDQQEVDLGDAAADSFARYYSLIDDPELTQHVEKLGARLAEHLPPNHLRFQFFLIDAPEVNAFSLPGGRIYLTRKIVALTRNDDELAGVVAHEMGHVVAHQAAIFVSSILKQVLGVTEVGDRADIYDKVQRVFDKQGRKPFKISEQGDGDQYVADQVALFAMARAGFAPPAYVDLFDRFNDTHGDAGNWFTDMLGRTNPEQKRLRELLKSVSTMPAACAGIATSSPVEFETWQARVVASRAGTHSESLPGLLIRKKLASPLRPDINNLRFSPDGKYVLAQDEGGIHVLSRDPFQMLFFIDAPDADKAQFSPDSKSVVFKSPSLRIETWDIAAQNRTSVREILLRVLCIQSALSPDGKYLACLDREYALHLVEVANGKELISKKRFLEAGSSAAGELPMSGATESMHVPVSHLSFSPDAQYFVAGTVNSDLAYSLSENRPLKVPSSVRTVMHEEFAFVDSSRIVGLNSFDPSKSAIVKFPSGELVRHVKLTYGLTLGATPQGKYIAVGPLQNGKRGFIDLETGKLNGVCKEDAGDIYDRTIVYEELDGGLVLIEAPSGKVVSRAQLTLSHLGEHGAIAVSDDFNRLAASTQTRGAVWDLSHNQRIQLLRVFAGGWFAEDGSLYADFPQGANKERAVVQMDPQGDAWTVFPIGQLPAKQEGPYVLIRRPQHGHTNPRNSTYELWDFRRKQVLWARDFTLEPASVFLTSDFGKILMGWSVANAAGHQELKNLPDLKNSAQKDDMFYELVDLKSGMLQSKLLVKTNKLSFRIEGAKVDGDWAAFEVSGDRVLIYSLASDREQGHAFGYAPVISGAGGVYAVSAGEGQVNVYRLSDSHLRQSYKFPKSIAYKRFSPDGKRLFVLTRDQTAYVLDLNSAVNPQSVAAKTSPSE